MIVCTASPSPPPTFLSSSSALFLSSPVSSFRAWDRKAEKRIWKQLQKIRYKALPNSYIVPLSFLFLVDETPNWLKQGNRRNSGVCRAELVHDAPFAAAIGACVLSSLVFPISASEAEHEDTDGPIDATDARFAVMGIMSFIPYFNWLSWVFAWMDSGRQRYLVYAIVYLAPYLRTNLSLSPEDSWLPIASILVCILHIQLEVSIKNGDVKGIQFFNEASNLLSTMIRNREMESDIPHESSHKERSKRNMELPSSHGLRDKVREWGIPRKESEDLDADEKKNNSH